MLGILGDMAGLPPLFLDRTVSGTKRSDGDAEFSEEHVQEVVSFTLVPMLLSVSSLPMGYRLGGNVLKTDPRCCPIGVICPRKEGKGELDADAQAEVVVVVLLRG